MKKRFAIIAAALAFVLCVCSASPAYILASEVSSSEVLVIAPAPDAAADEEFIPDDEQLELLLSDADGAIENILPVTPSDTEVPREQNIKDSLKIMGQGMLGIFVVMLLIYLVVVILNAVTRDSSEDGEEE